MCDEGLHALEPEVQRLGETVPAKFHLTTIRGFRGGNDPEIVVVFGTEIAEPIPHLGKIDDALVVTIPPCAINIVQAISRSVGGDLKA
ncbi:MAG: hypothetical protein BGN91_14455 [Nitrobacter sp. 62-13]|uniref:hypothetical protein n=1 Tax=Nitrobacter sp. 62-13 TaxID=1895797 RepID=UPI00096292F7|nr:hypothetical protein [Nitrobacter sp. 62-13]OJU24067.1 MAG: hypothetical protein BGN91_14455 [Nitrobacter sp. 62-13]